MIHPPRGTCVPDCSRYGLCHDGCGQATRVAPQRRGSEVVRGRHYSYRPGHGPGCHQGPPPGSKGKVPAERVRPLAEFLAARYPDSAIKGITGLEPRTLYQIRYGLTRKVHLRTAEVLVRTVLAHRRGQAQPWDTFDSGPRRLPVTEQRAHRNAPVTRPSCGLERGYQAHWEHFEEPCDPCRVAHKEKEARTRRWVRDFDRAATSRPDG